MPVDRCLKRVACSLIESGSMTDMRLRIRCNQAAPDGLVELGPITLCWPAGITGNVPA